MKYQCKMPTVDAFQMTYENAYDNRTLWPEWLQEIFLPYEDVSAVKTGRMRNRLYLGDIYSIVGFVLVNYQGDIECIGFTDWIINYTGNFIKMNDYEFTKFYEPRY